MSATVRPVPEGYHTVTPAITCRGAAGAIEFYKKALGAKEIARMEGPGGTIAHAEIQIGDSKIMLGDEWPGQTAAPSATAPASASLFIYLPEVDKAFNTAVAAGCQVVMPPTDMFWGDRYGKLRDPYGHHWGLATHIEDVSMEEMKRRSDEFMAKMAKGAGQS
ncbi:MAG: VOC family protein [Candidatus Acidiferrales bacterium]|jgi:PhnB protein